jgi:ABC-type sugar transport system permease subunit
VFSLWVSLTSWKLPGKVRTFIGTENYTRLARDPEFMRVVVNTLLYSMTVVLVAQSLAFVLALALSKQRRGAAAFRFFAFTPHVTLGVAAAIAWLLVLDPNAGPAAGLYSAWVMEGPNWIGDSRLALAALALVGAWKEIGFATLFFLAGLQTLPREPYEAARLEGVSALREAWSLTLPMMSPVVFFLAVSGFVAAFKTFDTVAVMTQGGPVYPDSSLFVYHLYRTGFRDFEIGYASALANVLWLILLVFAMVQVRGARRWVSHDT